MGAERPAPVHVYTRREPGVFVKVAAILAAQSCVVQVGPNLVPSLLHPPCKNGEVRNGACRSKMRKRRLGRGSPVTSQLVLCDFELFDDRSGVEVTVHAQELKDLFEQLARANSFKLEDLLANTGASCTEKPLQCRVVTRLPAGGGWSFDDSGYISLKLKSSCTVRGHTFLGNAADHDSDFHLRLSRSVR